MLPCHGRIIRIIHYNTAIKKTCERASEQILNGTSAQLGYTVPFTLVHTRKYRTEDKLKTDITKTKHKARKSKRRKILKNKTSPV